MRALLFVFLAVPAMADKTVPYYTRSTNKNQDMGAINKNLLDITGRNRDKLVPIVGDQDCSLNGGALVGATEKGGYIFGGSCTKAIPGAMSFLSSQAWTSAFYSTFSLVAASGGAHVDCVADYILTVSSSAAVLRFSDDTTTGDYQYSDIVSSNAASSVVSNANANNINLVNNAAATAKNHHVRARFGYSVLLDKVKEVAVETSSVLVDVVGNEVRISGAGTWSGGNTPTDGIINTPGSLSSGVVTCYYTQL